MPRARCHWALLAQTRDALRESDAGAYELLVRRRAEFFAGGVAPDALRLFGGQDKAGTHFYDDQRPDTWERVVSAICTAYPQVADASALGEAARAWMAGYIAHVLTDVAYWRHVVTKLPPFPEHLDVHHGAWMLADQSHVPPGERGLDVEGICFAAAPPWVEPAPVKELLARIARWFTSRDDPFAVEVAYYRTRATSSGPLPDSDAALLEQHRPGWQRCLDQIQAALPPETWDAFRRDAVLTASRAISTYLRG